MGRGGEGEGRAWTAHPQGCASLWPPPWLKKRGRSKGGNVDSKRSIVHNACVCQTVWQLEKGRHRRCRKVHEHAHACIFHFPSCLRPYLPIHNIPVLILIQLRRCMSMCVPQPAVCQLPELPFKRPSCLSTTHVSSKLPKLPPSCHSCLPSA